MERSLYWYIGSLCILTKTYTTALTTKQVARKVLFLPCLQVTNKDDLYKENARIKKVFKENEYQESIIVKYLRELLTITACLSHSNKRKPHISKWKRSE